MSSTVMARNLARSANYNDYLAKVPHFERLQIPSPQGTWEATFSEQGLISLDWLGSDVPATTHSGPSSPEAERLLQQLTQYFYDPDPTHTEAFEDFKDIPIDWDSLPGTPFHRKVWQAIYTIPFGKTQTYGWIAERIGSPKSFRAVGQGTGRNPIPIVIPCHRVTATNGKLGGFMLGHPQGLSIKRFLLSREGHTAR